MTELRRLKRPALAGLLALLVASFSGCIYLRLNALRKQWASFDKFVMVGGEPDLAFTFKRPVLRSEDLVTLFKQPPTEEQEAGPIRTWLWVLEKQPGGPGEDQAAHAFTFTTTFTSNKLSQMVIPREILRVVPRDAAIQMIKALGRARVNTGERSAAVKFPAEGASTNSFVCTTQDVTRLLGVPQQTKDAAGTIVWGYRYALRPPPAWSAAGMDVAGDFVFRKEDQRMVDAQIRFTSHRVNVKM
jgi:hypothetical protein